MEKPRGQGGKEREVAVRREQGDMGDRGDRHSARDVERVQERGRRLLHHAPAGQVRGGDICNSPAASALTAD
eukprot:756340-Hanusia_phi.AAC.1